MSLHRLLLIFATSPRNPIRKRHRIYEREYLAQGAVPILLLTGEKDTTILPEQSESLHHRAQSFGLDSTLVLVSNSGHGWRPLGGPIVPSQEEIHTLTAEFIRKHTSRRTD